jgi:hypothetical protein
MQGGKKITKSASGQTIAISMTFGPSLTTTRFVT